MKGVYYEMDKQIIKEYANATFCAMNGSNGMLELFKKQHNNEYKTISAMYRKRVALMDTLMAMSYLDDIVYWFTLTYNNDKDKNTEKYKLNEATMFLKDIAPVYVLVEEYGENNGRYHIHGFLIFKYGYNIQDFKSWHSRQNLIELDQSSFKKKVRYLTKYACKDVPRIHRSKQCSTIYKCYVKNKRLGNHFECLLRDKMKQCVDNSVNLF